MIVKICPLCDSEMKKAHYCDVCNSFVWKPTILDVHYNTDSRGRGEIDCSYGEVHDQVDHHQSHIERQHKENEAYWREHQRQQKEFEERRHGTRRANAARKNSAAGDHAEVFGSQTQKKKKTGTGCGGCVTWIIIAFVLIRLIAGMSGLSGVLSRNLSQLIWKLEHQILHISREIDLQESAAADAGILTAEYDPEPAEYAVLTEYCAEEEYAANVSGYLRQSGMEWRLDEQAESRA